MPVIVEPLEGSCPPVEVFAGLAGLPGSFLLDSGSAGFGEAAYSFVGCAPFLTLRSERGAVQVDGVVVGKGDGFRELGDLMRKFASGGREEVPFVGGAVGFFSYEMGAAWEGVQPRGQDGEGTPDLAWNFYDGVLAFDHARNRWLAVANPVHQRGADEILTELRARLAHERMRMPTNARAQTGVCAQEPSANLTFAEYAERIRRIKDYIRSGDVYQINLTQRFRVPLSGDPWEIYLRLRERSPARFAGYFQGGGYQILSSSPESFLRVRGRTVETRPIKGTRPRGRTEHEDEQLRRELLASEKDRAELLMIVDLERNDLGRVCVPGSVNARDLYRLETHPTLHHLVATVTGELRPGCGPLEAIKACFPGGSITGAPKIRAMQIIKELEPCRRGVYTGSMGYLSFDGNVDLNIAIRTIVCNAGTASYHVGSGVVWDSEVNAEYEETLVKGRALRAALTGE